ncbi:TIGR04282 family arsenosugar biosynthesis glycosyltransferase [Pontibacter sp. G13]|uniref:TIGR04282 family arsenosugar biosynthesis glycosyltransferase n=1 Tax=Pontibacter sp. G13 TaxID=3074898 RepID=UPI00288BBD68|nr:TIGR04282 family arsenosugar biosynthesis glycosyltransferase [Pontibacter sp. G13]WNJ21316.1 TIGR04282 family arsenosugar biosynthesis glycosyltransferase [Pontibacter sp. G13]
MASQSRLLLIFVKDPIPGQVKTRLAADIGHEKALAVYRELLAHTRRLAASVDAHPWVWYGNRVPENDLWSEAGFERTLQTGDDLGERMELAFADGFERGFREICIIGSDCAQLTAEILTDAFDQLTKQDAVIGPAQDGGYYLIGMNRLHAGVFRGKTWSTDTVFEETVADLQSANLSIHQLPTLSDVDHASDLRGTFLESYLTSESDMKDILDKLNHGDKRSLEGVEEVLAMAESQPELLPVLFDGMYDPRPLVRMRAADIVEKLTKKNYSLLAPFKDRLIGDLGKFRLDEDTQMSIPILLGRLQLEGNEVPLVVDNLIDWLYDTPKKFVKVFCMQSMVDQALKHPWLLEEVEMIVQSQMEEGTNAIKARGRHLLKAIDRYRTKTKDSQ